MGLPVDPSEQPEELGVVPGYGASGMSGTSDSFYKKNWFLKISRKFGLYQFHLTAHKYMFYGFILLFMLAFVNVKAQIISTICGNGTLTNTGDGGPAIAAAIDFPVGGVFDKYGNYYFATGDGGYSVREIKATGVIMTVAGGAMGYSGDGGPATNARMNDPQGVAVDTLGNLYIVDEGNEDVRKVDAATGIITTIAGNGTEGYSGDGGPATNAMLYGAQDICLDKAGNIYIADYENNRIRKISTAGIISTFVGGNGGGVYHGDGGMADTSEIKAPTGVCMDNIGNLYIAENSGCRVRKVNTSGIISTVAGNGSYGYSGDGGLATSAQSIPFKICVDKFENIYVLEDYTSVIRMVNKSGTINTIAGNGIDGFSGDGGPADSAEIYTRTGGGITTDTCGNLYIGDVNNYRIRKVTYPFCDYLDVSVPIQPSALTLQPNPATTQLTISLDAQIAQIIIMSISGQTVYRQSCNAPKVEINIALLPSGLYLAVIIDEEGNKTIKKFVKQ